MQARIGRYSSFSASFPFIHSRTVFISHLPIGNEEDVRSFGRARLFVQCLMCVRSRLVILGPLLQLFIRTARAQYAHQNVSFFPSRLDYAVAPCSASSGIAAPVDVKLEQTFPAALAGGRYVFVS